MVVDRRMYGGSISFTRAPLSATVHFAAPGQRHGIDVHQRQPHSPGRAHALARRLLLCDHIADDSRVRKHN